MAKDGLAEDDTTEPGATKRNWVGRMRVLVGLKSSAKKVKAKLRRDKATEPELDEDLDFDIPVVEISADEDVDAILGSPIEAVEKQVAKEKAIAEVDEAVAEQKLEAAKAQLKRAEEKDTANMTKEQWLVHKAMLNGLREQERTFTEDLEAANRAVDSFHRREEMQKIYPEMVDRKLVAFAALDSCLDGDDIDDDDLAGKIKGVLGDASDADAMRLVATTDTEGTAEANQAGFVARARQLMASIEGDSKRMVQPTTPDGKEMPALTGAEKAQLLKMLSVARKVAKTEDFNTAHLLLNEVEVLRVAMVSAKRGVFNLGRDEVDTKLEQQAVGRGADTRIQPSAEALELVAKSDAYWAQSRPLKDKIIQFLDATIRGSQQAKKDLDACNAAVEALEIKSAIRETEENGDIAGRTAIVVTNIGKLDALTQRLAGMDSLLERHREVGERMRAELKGRVDIQRAALYDRIQTKKVKVEGEDGETEEQLAPKTKTTEKGGEHYKTKGRRDLHRVGHKLKIHKDIPVELVDLVQSQIGALDALIAGENFDFQSQGLLDQMLDGLDARIADMEKWKRDPDGIEKLVAQVEKKLASKTMAAHNPYGQARLKADWSDLQKAYPVAPYEDAGKTLEDFLAVISEARDHALKLKERKDRFEERHRHLTTGMFDRIGKDLKTAWEKHVNTGKPPAYIKDKKYLGPYVETLMRVKADTDVYEEDSLIAGWARLEVAYKDLDARVAELMGIIEKEQLTDQERVEFEKILGEQAEGGERKEQREKYEESYKHNDKCVRLRLKYFMNNFKGVSAPVQEAKAIDMRRKALEAKVKADENYKTAYDEIWSLYNELIDLQKRAENVRNIKRMDLSAAIDNYESNMQELKRDLNAFYDTNIKAERDALAKIAVADLDEKQAEFLAAARNKAEFDRLIKALIDPLSNKQLSPMKEALKSGEERTRLAAREKCLSVLRTDRNHLRGSVPGKIYLKNPFDSGTPVWAFLDTLDQLNVALLTNVTPDKK